MLSFGLIILLIAISLIVAVVSYKIKRKPAVEDIPLKKYGKRIIVDFNDCEVRSREYNEEVVNDSFPSKLEMLDALGGHSTSGQGNYIKKIVSEVRYSITDEKGVSHVFRSNPIFTSEVMVRYRMLEQKTAVIYVDPENWDNYYFDVNAGTDSQTL